MQITDQIVECWTWKYNSTTKNICYCSLDGTKAKSPYLSIMQIFQNVSQFWTVEVHVGIIVHDVIRGDDSTSVRNNVQNFLHNSLWNVVIPQ